MTKEQVRRHLEMHPDEYVSGAQIAQELNMTRTAVWKAIGQLKADGYSIDSVTNRGYRLSSDCDVLTKEGISRYLPDDGYDLRVFSCVESTNTLLKGEAQKGASEKTVIAASQQTAGRGRMGRSFYSPFGSGVYLSILLRPAFSAEQSLKVTSCAAVAAAQTLEDLSGNKTEIKWVNDIQIEGKKVCGILTEAALNCENGGLDYVIVGFGVNVRTPEQGFPEEIANSAGAVFGTMPPGGSSCRIAAGIVERFFSLYQDLDSERAYREYIRRSNVLGKQVNLIPFGGEPEQAEVLNIDRDYALIVKKRSGEICRVQSGEVSLRVRT